MCMWTVLYAFKRQEKQQQAAIFFYVYAAYISANYTGFCFRVVLIDTYLILNIKYMLQWLQYTVCRR